MNPLHTCAERTRSVAAQQACCRLSSNQRGQSCPREMRNVFNETHILEERLPAIGVVPKQAVIVHDVIQHTFGHACTVEKLLSSASTRHPAT